MNGTIELNDNLTNVVLESALEVGTLSTATKDLIRKRNRIVIKPYETK